MSKKEIRRAARDAFPKAKRAPAGKKGRTSGAYGRRTVAAGPGARGTADRSAIKPPSVRRSVIMGLILGLLYFAVIQWLWRSAKTSVGVNILFSVVGAFLFAGVNYLTERFRYRRYQRKRQDSSK